MQTHYCIWCAWKTPGELKCLAYPNGIPTDILLGEREHEQVLHDQIGDYTHVTNVIYAEAEKEVTDEEKQQQ